MPSEDQRIAAAEAAQKLLDFPITEKVATPIVRYMIAAERERSLINDRLDSLRDEIFQTIMGYQEEIARLNRIVNGEPELTAAETMWFKTFNELREFTIRGNRKLQRFYDEALFCITHGLPYHSYTTDMLSTSAMARMLG